MFRIYVMVKKCCQKVNKNFSSHFSNIIGKEEEARVHQHMHVVAQRQVRENILTYYTLDFLLLETLS